MRGTRRGKRDRSGAVWKGRGKREEREGK